VIYDCDGTTGYAILAGFSWVFEEGNLIQATIFLVGIWSLVFNDVFALGMKCLKQDEVKYFFLPLASIATVGYSYGYLIQQA